MTRAPANPKTFATVRAEFEAARSALIAASELYENQGGAYPDPEAARFRAARGSLLACPAPDAAALAFKIAAHPDAPDFSDFDETLPDAEAWRSIYNDALALAAPVATHPEIEAEIEAVHDLGERANNSPDLSLIDEWAARDDALLARIEALPCAPENATIKARAIVHIHRSSGLAFPEEATTDVRLAAQVVACIVGEPL
jgi:hypothetical protein